MNRWASYLLAQPNGLRSSSDDDVAVVSAEEHVSVVVSAFLEVSDFAQCEVEPEL